MKMQDILRDLRIKAGLTQEDVAKALKVTKQTIYKYENGIVTNIPLDKIEQMADLFGVDPASILGWDRDSTLPSNLLPITTMRVPLLGTIACGEPIYAEEELESYVTIGTDIRCDFALRCKGDSMINARIYDGDVVFIRKQVTVADGEIAAVILDDEATLKRFRRLPGGMSMLTAENPSYPPIIVGGESELRSVRILGKAVAFQGDVV